MKFAFEVTCRMRVSRELGPKVHRRAAALAVESSHREIVGAGVNVPPKGETPAPPHARDIDVITSRVMNRREVGRLNHVAGVRVVSDGPELALENNGVVAGPLQRERLRGRAYQGDLGTVYGVANLVDFDRRRGILGAA